MRNEVDNPRVRRGIAAEDKAVKGIVYGDET